MKLDSLQDLFHDLLKDTYDAEHQITKALPKMAKAATNPKLKAAFEKHLTQTEGHIKRLEQVFEAIDKKPTRKSCVGMKGLIEEGAEIMKEDTEPEVLDAGLIAAAQKVEHYEIAAYGTAASYANMLGEGQAAGLLQETLDEEKMTDEKLTQLAENTVNVQAA
jgi:ferritin-like metal-binding protein YciE